MAAKPRPVNVLKLEADVADLQAALKMVQKENKSLNKGLDHQAKENEKLRKTQVKQEAQLRKNARTTSKALAVNKKFAASLRTIGIAGASATGVVYGLQRAMSASFRAAISFDRQLVNIRKTTGLTVREMEKLSGIIKEISVAQGLNRDQVAGIAAVGGRFGIQDVQQLALLTNITAQLERATDLSSERAAEAAVKVINLTGGNIARDLEAFADAMVHIANNSAVAESTMADLSIQLASILGRFGVSATEVLAFSSSLGIAEGQAQGAATALNNLSIEMITMAEEGGDRFNELARIMGRSSEQLGKDIKENFTDTLVEVLETIRQFDAVSQDKLFSDIFGIEDIRRQQALFRIIPTIKRQLALSQREASRGALPRETAFRLDSTSGELDTSTQQLKAKLAVAGDTISEGAVSIFADLTDGFDKFIERLASVALFLTNLPAIIAEGVTKSTDISSAVAKLLAESAGVDTSKQIIIPGSLPDQKRHAARMGRLARSTNIRGEHFYPPEIRDAVAHMVDPFGNVPNSNEPIGFARRAWL